MASLDLTFGAMLIGVIVAGVLYGITCSQTYYYFSRYQKDPWFIKLIVVAVWITDTTHQALVSHSIYFYLITAWGDPVALSSLTRTLIAEVFFNFLTGLFVQGFFVARIWTLSGKNLFITIPISILVVASFASGFSFGIMGASLQNFEQIIAFQPICVAFNALTAAADVIIAIVLCVILHTSRTGFSRSDALINKLIAFAVNTGLLTAVCSCLALITFVVLPDKLLYIAFFFLLGRLYANSLLATLNARKTLRDLSTSQELSLSLRDIQPPTTASMSTPSRGGRANDIAIHINTLQESKHDLESQYGNSHKHRVEEV
ncbi:hypothetical protein C2E23DRAFT_931744 [Lenzites betulinus]|nr:hypothetical protein C2E23DRAFT_931744 [Lenzites betulinus]